MSNRRTHRVILSDYKAKKEQEGAIIIEADSGEFRVAPPVLWPDEVVAAGKANDNVAMAKGLLGEAEYARWLTEGGTAALLLDIVGESLGVDTGES